MNHQNIKKLTNMLKDMQEHQKYQDDLNVITELYIKIGELQNYQRTTTMIILDEIRNQIQYLDMKYDDVYDLVNLYDPIYIDCKKEIKKRNVKKIREENRKKREGK